MPHVLLLPLAQIVLPDLNGTTLPALKADKINDTESFVIHSKRYTEVCTNGKCWPYYEDV
jgi:hypothetical protein